MILEMTKEQTIKLIKGYYKINEKMDVDVKFDTFTSYYGDFNRQSLINTNIIVEAKKEILNEVFEFNYKLDMEDTKKILKTLLLEQIDFDEMDIRYNINRSEQFEGITVNVKSKQKVKN